MNASSRSKIVLPLAVAAGGVCVLGTCRRASAAARRRAAAAQGHRRRVRQPPPVRGPPGAVPDRASDGPGGPGPHVAAGRSRTRASRGGPGGARVVHGGPIPSRNFAGHAYRGHLAWEGGRWRHEVHNGRMGWWWDVGGVWYFYPERFDGPPGYISEDYADDVGYDAVRRRSPAPMRRLPAPTRRHPPPDPGASAVGGAIVGGVLGGLLTGRASGAAAGAVIGGATGASGAAARAGLLGRRRRLLLPLSRPGSTCWPIRAGATDPRS